MLRSSSVPVTLGHLGTAKLLNLEFVFAENQTYYPITNLISGRRPMSHISSAYHSAVITREDARSLAMRVVSSPF